MYLEVYVFNSLTVSEEQVFDEVALPHFPTHEILKKEIEATVKSIKWLDEENGQIDISDFQGQLILGKCQRQ
jgi:hypothetical protein